MSGWGEGVVIAYFSQSWPPLVTVVGDLSDERYYYLSSDFLHSYCNFN